MMRVLILALIAILASCKFGGKKTSGEKDALCAQKKMFEKKLHGKQISLFALENKNGMKVTFTNYGGKVVNLCVPDRDGNIADVALGYNSIDDYIGGVKSFGATIGRFANRIANGKFELDGQVYSLPVNNGANCLHSGPDGFYVKVFDAKEMVTAYGKAVKFSYLSPDGENGFPGNLSVDVTFTLTDDNELRVDYKAITDKPTVINLTNHSYFNLKGEGNGTILDHEVVINGDKVAEVTGNDLIPTGRFTDILNTPMDFTSPRLIGKDIDSSFDIMVYGNGYDHAWALSRGGKDGLIFAASAYEPVSGRFMEVYTTEPSVQFYTGNFLDGTEIGKRGLPYGKRSGFCLETQHFPNSPNNPEYPTTVLRPGEVYESVTVYKFSVK